MTRPSLERRGDKNHAAPCLIFELEFCTRQTTDPLDAQNSLLLRWLNEILKQKFISSLKLFMQIYKIKISKIWTFFLLKNLIFNEIVKNVESWFWLLIIFNFFVPFINGEKEWNWLGEWWMSLSKKLNFFLTHCFATGR